MSPVAPSTANALSTEENRKGAVVRRHRRACLLLLFVSGVLFFKTVSLCSPGGPETRSVAQADLGLSDPSASVPPGAGVKSIFHHSQAK